MPPKSKSRKPGPAQDKPKASTPQQLTSENNAKETQQEVEDQFEVELCWCIQQLETCLVSGKVQDKQAHELAKQINTLKSGTAPLIKKRQIMRNSLGDYRAKMAQDKNKYLKTVSSVKFISNVPTKKSVFIKKAGGNRPGSEGTVLPKTDNSLTNSNSINIEPTTPKFTFNFQ